MKKHNYAELSKAMLVTEFGNNWSEDILIEDKAGGDAQSSSGAWTSRWVRPSRFLLNVLSHN